MALTLLERMMRIRTDKGDPHVVAQLIYELRKPEYFCPGVGGVVRDIPWLVARLQHYQLAFDTRELTVALNQLITSYYIRMTLGVDTAGHWYIGLTLSS